MTRIDSSNDSSTLAKVSITEALLTQISLRPDSIAAVSELGELTFRELGYQSYAVGALLIAGGAAKDVVVGVYAGPGLELLVAIWGVLFSGSAYCPLSPDYPEVRVRHMIETSGMSTIVCEESLKDRLADICPVGIVILSIRDALEMTRLRVCGDPFSAVESNALAYVIFTSGSTGTPKGVMIEHAAISNQMAWITQAYGVGPGTTVLQKTPSSFDAAQWEILAPAYGARVIFGRLGNHRDPERMIHLIMKFTVTTLQCTPTLLRALLQTERLGECSSLIHVFSGGESLSQKLARDCLIALPKVRLINLYGPTECTINVSSFEVRWDAIDRYPKTIPVGYPVTGTGLTVMDKSMHPVLGEESGELYISGVQVARGYLNRPELSSERFIANPGHPTSQIYGTGDIARWNLDGSLQIIGRIDNQIKLRGYRIELDEIRATIQNHNWVKDAVVFTQTDMRTGTDLLVAVIELNPAQAQLMDAGSAGAHHRSKRDKTQVKAQLAGQGRRSLAELKDMGVERLPGRVPSISQVQFAFARKTYRHFEGTEQVSIKEIESLLSRISSRQQTRSFRSLASISLSEFGHLFRYFGAFESASRLLPKYTYASPGALNATQLYLELSGIAGFQAGIYYYHPGDHSIYRVSTISTCDDVRMRLHFVGKHRAIEPVYKLNIREVLEIEVGHMLGVFDQCLDELGLHISGASQEQGMLERLCCTSNDFYIGSFDVSSHERWLPPPLSVHVQLHGADRSTSDVGLYCFDDGMRKITDRIVEKRHVIAINQKTFQASSFGIALGVSDARSWSAYITLGLGLQLLQMNDQRIGLMSSGYSSRSGDDLRAASRIRELVGDQGAAIYFCVGGRISEEQLLHRGMKEDLIHTKGPVELIRDDLKSSLPDFMLPSRMTLIPSLPLSASGKVDIQALKELNLQELASPHGPEVAPRDAVEERLAGLWREALSLEQVFVRDDFFQSGGDSLSAVAFISKVNKTMGFDLPLETLFNASTIETLAILLQDTTRRARSRLISLCDVPNSRPIIVWPGLGGFPMNLRALGNGLSRRGRTTLGIMAQGLNKDETLLTTIADIARADIDEIHRKQPSGPYTLVGYSFGGRIAFEVACQLEARGERVDRLMLIAPGVPRMKSSKRPGELGGFGFEDPGYVTILLSVFTQAITGPEVDSCISRVHDAASFIEFVLETKPDMDRALVQRIVALARVTYDMTLQQNKFAAKCVMTPTVVFNAQGDEPSFVEKGGGSFSGEQQVVQLSNDHYDVLKPKGVEELLDHLRSLP